MVAGGGIKHFWIEYHGYKQKQYYCIALFLVINLKKIVWLFKVYILLSQTKIKVIFHNKEFIRMSCNEM